MQSSQTIRFPMRYTIISEEEQIYLGGGALEDIVNEIYKAGKVFTYIGRVFSAIGTMLNSIKSIYTSMDTLVTYVQKNY